MKKFVVIGLSILLAVFLVESYLQLFSNNKPLSTEWILLEGEERSWSSDPDVIFITNRVRDLLNAPKTDRKTLITLGDSFTQGDPVEEKDNFPNILQSLLTGASSDLQIVNLGVGGFGADQELRLFQKYLKQNHRPSVVVWSFYNNDIYENYTQPVFDLTTNGLTPLPANANWIYKREIFYDSIPLPRSIKMRSRLINWLLLLFERSKTAQVPPSYRSNPEKWSMLKISKELETMDSLSRQYDFRWIPVLIVPQAAYLNENERQEPAQWTMADHQVLQEILERRADVLTLDFSQHSASDSPVLGTNSQIANDYFADEIRDHLPMGVRHFNETGYKLFAHRVFDQLKIGALK